MAVLHELRGAGVTLRGWRDADLAAFAAMNADPAVMTHFPAPLSRADSDAMAARGRAHFAAHGWGLWALETPALAFAGFVGLSAGTFDLPATLWPAGAPATEIGWRLATAAQGRGHATAAARLALAFAREALGLPAVVSFTALGNTPSQAVMRRLGMNRLGEFEHPRVAEGHRLRRHVLYATAWAG